MISKNKRIRQKKHERFLAEKIKQEEYFDLTYPGWRMSKNADYIKRRIHDTAKQAITGVYRKKTKAVYKKDFGDKWPFTVDRVIIVQTAKKNATVKMVTVLIGFEQFALSGLAASHFNIPLVSDTKFQIKGKSTGIFHQTGVEL